MNNMMQVGGTCLELGNTLIHWLAIAAAVGGLVVCILNRRLSSSMILIIVGFGGLIAVGLLPQLIGALYRLTGISPEVGLILNFFTMFINFCGPVSIGLIVWGLTLVFADMKRRLGLDAGGGARGSRRRLDEEDEDDDRPARRPRNPGSRDIER